MQTLTITYELNQPLTLNITIILNILFIRIFIMNFIHEWKKTARDYYRIRVDCVLNLSKRHKTRSPC